MIFGESRLKDLYRRAVWGPGREALEALPAPLELRLLAAGARAAAMALPAKRAKVAENLARGLPDLSAEVLDALAAETFEAHVANQYISFSFPKCDARTWQRYLTFRGLDRLQEAWARGRGVVLTHPHLGPAQLPLHVLGVLGWPMHQIGGGRITLVDLSETGQWAAQTRGRLEARMPVILHDGKRFLRPVLRALGEGAVVMTACDGTGGGDELGRRLTRVVLGQRMPLPIGPIWLAYTSGAPLLSVACHRARGAGPPWVAEVGPEIVLPRDQGKAAALEAGADAIAALLDGTLRAWPGDWLFWDGFQPGGLLEAAP